MKQRTSSGMKDTAWRPVCWTSPPRPEDFNPSPVLPGRTRAARPGGPTKCEPAKVELSDLRGDGQRSVVDVASMAEKPYRKVGKCKLDMGMFFLAQTHVTYSIYILCIIYIYTPSQKVRLKPPGTYIKVSYSSPTHRVCGVHRVIRRTRTILLGCPSWRSHLLLSSRSDSLVSPGR